MPAVWRADSTVAAQSPIVMRRRSEGRLVRDEMFHPIDDGDLARCPLRVECKPKRLHCALHK
jgi:hypothetical protein